MSYRSEFHIGTNRVSINDRTYFIADIAANHDGDLQRAKDLIRSAKDSGADCAKFQHFLANRIVRAAGFADGVGKVSHQAGWTKSVTEIYDQYHTQRDWTGVLLETCREYEIEFMTTPYDFESVRMFADLVPAYKIGSGDITFIEILEEIAKVGKPILLATGASSMAEVERAVATILKHNDALCLMQCNTNYTGDVKNFHYVNLRVLDTFSARWPGMPLGLSDHTPGHSAVLGAVSLGARVVEKHFTDDNSREGPDHSFALNPVTWREMVTATRELEAALGSGEKRIEENEKETVVIQRRALCAVAEMKAGTVIAPDHLEALRPCPPGAASADQLAELVGQRLMVNKEGGKAILWSDLA